MDNKLWSIISLAQDKYGHDHALTLKVENTIIPLMKCSSEYPGQSVDINIDELESLFNPDKFEFEKQEIEQIGIKL